MPFYPFLGEGSPTKIDYRKKGTRISLLEDLGNVFVCTWANETTRKAATKGRATQTQPTSM